MSVADSGTKTRLAKELGVSRSSLYYRHKIPEKDEELRRQIEAIMEENPGYGSPRVAIALGINEKRAARVMKKFGLKPARRAYKSPLKPVGRKALSYPNILSILSPIAPDVVWASDFTFIDYKGNRIYLCTVIDIFTGEVLGFNISKHHTASFVRLAIERAIKRANGILPQYFHSDQGSEYSSETVCQWLQSMGVQTSMNPKGSPWCNGSQESFFGRFKVEFGEFNRFDSYADLLEELYSQLYYFTHRRIKTKLKMAPSQFRQLWIERRNALLTTNSQVISLPPDPPHYRQLCLSNTSPQPLATTTINLLLVNSV